MPSIALWQWKGRQQKQQQQENLLRPAWPDRGAAAAVAAAGRKNGKCKPVPPPPSLSSFPLFLPSMTQFENSACNAKNALRPRPRTMLTLWSWNGRPQRREFRLPTGRAERNLIGEIIEKGARRDENDGKCLPDRSLIGFFVIVCFSNWAIIDFGEIVPPAEL
jgi:hypothetical protein